MNREIITPTPTPTKQETAKQAVIKRAKNNKYNIYVIFEGREIPVGTKVGEVLDKGLYKTTEFETYDDAVKWIDGSNGKFVLKQEE